MIKNSYCVGDAGKVSQKRNLDEFLGEEGDGSPGRNKQMRIESEKELELV